MVVKKIVTAAQVGLQKGFPVDFAYEGVTYYFVRVVCSDVLEAFEVEYRGENSDGEIELHVMLDKPLPVLIPDEKKH